MALGKVISVDTKLHELDIEAFSSSGNFYIKKVKIGDALPHLRSQPKPGDLMRIVKEGDYWVSTQYLWREDIETQEETEGEGLLPGDILIGKKGQPQITLYSGGMVKLLADDLTGIMSEANTKTTNMIGKNIAFDNSSYHEMISSTDSGGKIYRKLWGNIPNRFTEDLVDMSDGSITKSMEGISDITISINSLSPIGSNISIDTKSVAGNISLTIDGTTGNIKLNTPGSINITGMTIGFNTGDIPMPLQGVVTGETICPYTGGPHVDCSRTVFSKKV